MLNALYTIIIYPLYQIVEFAYRVFTAVFKNTGVSIIGVSVLITLLCLPLYNVAEKWSEVERETQKKMSYRISRIKKAFKGDERYMMLSAYNKLMGYNPLMALRSSFGILIQVPFFIAAYRFLSHNPDLQHKSFAFIEDMGQPDALFSIGSFNVNILPILMTIINIIAGAIYTKGFPIKEKFQIYAMALVFLVLLYNSPAGLVLYWTMNNVFSLVKHIFYKLKNPIKKFYILSCFATTGIVAFLLYKRFDRITIIILLYVVLLTLPLIIKFCKFLFKDLLISLFSEKGKSSVIFLQCCFAFAFLCGIVIPSFLMVDSTAEYCYLEGNDNPLFFIYNSFLQALGFFVFWPICLFYLFNKKIKSIMTFGFFAFILIGLVNAFFFQGNYGVVLPELVFSEHRTFFPTVSEFFANIFTILIVFTIITILFKKKNYKIITLISTITLTSLVLISIFNVSRIGLFYKGYEKPNVQISKMEKIINLSKTGKNVLVIMMDRSTGYIIDPVFENHPDLYEKFDGFVKYPNTVSFGFWTIQGAVCLYGGYEYTPWEMNHRRDIPMQEKHNEGISLQANIFAKNGYKVTVMDPPYPNYDQVPVGKAFASLPNTSFYQCIGKFRDMWYRDHNFPVIPIRSNLIKRNFIWFSLFKISPMILRPVIHYEEFWGPKKGSGGQDISHFIDNYSILDYMPQLTNLENKENCFVIMDNELPHDWVFTQYPEFEPAPKITDTGKGRWNEKTQYHVNVAGYKMLGKYFDFLKENDVWDNTRIIIVADHGANDRIKEKFDDSPMPRTLESYNPVLMMKDFNAKGKMTDDFTFMTHSDVPQMAFEGLIDNPVNPYTGNKIRKLTTEEKNKHTVISLSGANAVHSTVKNGYKIADTDWWTVHDNIFKAENWKQEIPEYHGYFGGKHE